MRRIFEGANITAAAPLRFLPAILGQRFKMGMCS
jgi:hypothetical protein